MIRLLDLLQESLGFSQDVVYYFTTLKDAGNILHSGKLFTSTGEIANDNDKEQGKRLASHHISFTRNPDFADGYPWNSEYDQQKKDSEGNVKHNTYGDVEYSKKNLIALVRFTVDTNILETLIQQASGIPFAKDFVFDLPKPKKPEQEERLWLELSKVNNFPKCIKAVCFNGELDSNTDYLNRLAVKVFQEAKTLGIPTFERRHTGKEVELKTPLYLYPRFGGEWLPGKSFDDPFGGKYDAFVNTAAICCARRDFQENRQAFLDYVSRRFEQNLKGKELHQFILDVESQTEKFLQDPRQIHSSDSSRKGRWVLTKVFEGDKNLQHDLIQMVVRACKQAGVERFGQLVTQRRQNLENQIQENMEKTFDYKQYLTEGWLHQEVKREPKQATTADLKGFATKDATLSREKRAQQGNWKNSVGKFVEDHGAEIGAAFANRQLRMFVEKTMKPALGAEAAQYLDNLLATCKNDTRLLTALYNVSMKGSGLGLHEEQGEGEESYP